MSIPRPTQYLDFEFDAFSARLRKVLDTVLPDLSTAGEAEPTRILLDHDAHVADVLGYYLRSMARESRLVTAAQRKNVIAHAKGLGYRPRGRSAATVPLEFSIPAPLEFDVPIPEGTLVSTVDISPAVFFRTLEEVVIEAGQTTSSEVQGENSTVKVDTFSATGEPNQTFTTSQRNYIDGSEAIVATNGVYTKAPSNSMLASRSNDLHYVTSIDQYGRCTFRFGNGVAGAVPVGDVQITYAHGGGAAGTGVARGSVRRVNDTIEANSQTITVLVTNPAESVDGEDAESNASIKAKAPLSHRLLTRAVHPEDFENAALTHTTTSGRIGRALCLTRNDDPTVGELEHVVWLVTPTGAAADAGLRDDVRALFVRVDGYPTPPFPANTLIRVTTRTAIYKTVGVFAVVYIRPGQKKAKVKADILARAASFFSPILAANRLREIAPEAAAEHGILATDGASQVANPLVDFGQRLKDSSIALSDVFNLVRDTPGVLKIGGNPADFLLNGRHADATLKVREFPKLGTVSLVDGDTGQPL